MASATRHKQVVNELDTLAGRGMRRAAKRYRAGVLDPILQAIAGAETAKGALRRLGPGLVREMDDTAIADPLAETIIASAGIGAAVAAPGKPGVLGKEKGGADAG